MKTYFMAWQSDNKRGHSIAGAPDDMDPREVLLQMIDAVNEKFKDSGMIGIVSANQFNRLD
jgi:hypothetical protein